MLLKLLLRRGEIVIVVSSSRYGLSVVLVYLEMIAIAVTLVTCRARHYALTVLIIPADALSFKPFASLTLAIGTCKLALTMLLSIQPSTFILTSIRPCQHTLTFFFVVHEATLIVATILPFEDAIAVHFVRLPVAFVFSSIDPFVHTLTLDVVVLELAQIA